METCEGSHTVRRVSDPSHTRTNAVSAYALGIGQCTVVPSRNRYHVLTSLNNITS